MPRERRIAALVVVLVLLSLLFARYWVLSGLPLCGDTSGGTFACARTP